MTTLLSNKNIVITGASMGIGKAVALQLAKEGANIVVNSSGSGPNGPGTDLSTLNEVANSIKQLGGSAIISAGSVADAEYAGELIDSCVDTFGSIDALINIAGVSEGSSTTIRNMDFENWHRVVGVHLHGTFNTCKHAIEYMAEQQSGAIINTGSHAFLGSYGGSAYAAAKGGIISLTSAIAKDMAEFKLRCNVVLPGAKTRLSTGEDYTKQIHDLNKRGLLSDERVYSALNAAPPETIAPVYAFLASDLAKDISGRVFSASGMHLGEFTWPDEQVFAVKDPSKGQAWQYAEIAQHLHPI